MNNKKILIIRLTSLGDVIFTLPLASTLNKNGAEISYLVAEKGLGVIKNNPIIKNVHFVPLQKWRKNKFSLKNVIEFWQLIKQIRAGNYDIAIDCQQMFKSLFLFLFCGAKRRITFSDAREFSNLAGNEFVKPKFKFRDYNYHIVERNLDFARYLGCNVEKIEFSLPNSSNETVKKVDDFMKGLDNQKPIIVISPATTWENKHWAIDNWKKLVERFKDEVNFVFTGCDNDNFLINEISQNCGLNLAGKTNLEELIDVFSRANAVISPDSGSAHLAWASGKPAVIGIFTCTPNKRFACYGEDKYISLIGNNPCQPCFKRKCKFKDKKKNLCMNYPTYQEVIEIVEKIINK